MATPRLTGSGHGEVQHVWVDVAGASGSANVFAGKANPFGKAMLILNVILHVTTIATAAATVDIGIAADATTAADTSLDGLDVHSAIGVFDSRDDTDNGTNGIAKAQLWTKDYYVNVKEASGNVDGLVGRLHIMCIPAAD